MAYELFASMIGPLSVSSNLFDMVLVAVYIDTISLVTKN